MAEEGMFGEIVEIVKPAQRRRAAQPKNLERGKEASGASEEPETAKALDANPADRAKINPTHTQGEVHKSNALA